MAEHTQGHRKPLAGAARARHHRRRPAIGNAGRPVSRDGPGGQRRACRYSRTTVPRERRYRQWSRPRCVPGQASIPTIKRRCIEPTTVQLLTMLSSDQGGPAWFQLASDRAVAAAPSDQGEHVGRRGDPSSAAARAGEGACLGLNGFGPYATAHRRQPSPPKSATASPRRPASSARALPRSNHGSSARNPD